MIPFEAVLFVLGAAVGSFANVCIYRLPQEGLSIVRPRSFCPACKKMIAWYDNVPIISWLLLGRRCRRCRAPIPVRYFLVELVLALGFLGLYFFYGISALWLIAAGLFAALVIVTVIDLDHQIIPDEISIPGILVGLAASALVPELHGAVNRWGALLDSGLGIVAGGGSIYLIGLFGNLVFKKESMGGGDVKLLAMIGAFLGWKLVILVFFLAPFFGTVVGVYQRVRYGAELIPYGPFLSLAAMITLLWGNDLLGYLFPYL